MENRRTAEKILRKMGGGGDYYGLRYTAAGAGHIIADSDYLISITKKLYRELAEEFGTSAVCVERDIRTFTEAIWKQGNRELLEAVAGRKLANRPSNKKFLDMLASHITYQGVCDE